MKQYLNGIRAKAPRSVGRFAALLLGIGLGVFSKFLDCTPANELPALLEALENALDVGNFLGRLSVWFAIAACLAVCSGSPAEAAGRVFAFFAGMVAAYYLYSKFIAGFFPEAYAMIWIGLTLLSPFLAWLCWYARGRGRTAVALSALIVGAAAWSAVTIGVWYVSVRGPLDVAALLAVIALYWRRDVRELAAVLGGGFLVLLLLQGVLPFSF